MSRMIKPATLIIAAMAVLIIVVFVLIFSHSIGVQVEQKPKKEQAGAEAPKELPPDQKAFYGTYAIREPEKRLEALERFVKDFPESSQITSAKREIFKATIKVWPDDKKKMLDSADSLIGEAGGNVFSAGVHNQFIARELFSAGIFPDEAERLATMSLNEFNKKDYIEDQKKKYAEWKKELPPDDVMNRKYDSEMAAYRTTLGRIYLNQGRMEEGEKILKEAYAVDPTISQAAVGLAEIAEKKGENAAALDYLTTATLTAGHAMTDTRSSLEILYRRTHSDSLDGLESKLDSRYEELFSNPIKVGQYQRTASRGNRVVLAESFTGAG